MKYKSTTLLLLTANLFHLSLSVFSGTRLGDFPTPDFSKTISLSNKGYQSFAEIDHKFGIVPFHVRVYSYVNDGPNGGYMFEGVGACQNDGIKSPTGGLIFAYNKDTIRVWTPVNNGSVVYVPKGWGGNVSSQHISEANVRIEAWKYGPSPAYEKEVQIHTRRKYVIYLEHPLLQPPEFISVRVSPTKRKTDGDFYYHAISGSHISSSTRIVGGVIFAYNEKQVVLWTPNTSKSGCIHIGKKWGNGRYYHPPIQNCTMHIRLWANSMPMPAFQTEWRTCHVNKKSFIEINHDFRHIPSYVKVQYRFPNQIHSLIFEGLGTVQTPSENSHKYGGVLFAYSTTKLRIWLPTGDHASIIYIGNGWGDRTKEISSNSAEIRVQFYNDRCFKNHEVTDALGYCRDVNETQLFQKMTKWSACDNACGQGAKERNVDDCVGRSLQPVINCQFDNGKCNFRTQGFPWVVSSGIPMQKASHLLQIPTQGPKKGTYFIYSNTSKATAGDYGILESPELKNEEGCILRFKYSTEAYFGKLQIDVYTANNKLKEDIWHMSDSQVMKGVWRTGYLNIGHAVGAIKSFQFVHQLKAADQGHYKCPVSCNPVSLADIVLECEHKSSYALLKEQCQEKEKTLTSCLINVFQPYERGPAWSIQSIKNIKKKVIGQFVSAVGEKEDKIATYQFYIQKAGNYQLWLDSFALTNSTNGITIQINDGQKYSRNIIFNRYNSLWLPVTISFLLQSGTYFLHLYQKEDSFHYKNVMIAPVDIDVWSDLGMQNRFIPDSSFQSIGGKSPNLAYSRLNGLGVWMPTDRNKGKFYLQIQLPEVALINRLATQGGKWLDSSASNKWYCYSDSYKIKFSLDGKSFAYYRNDTLNDKYLFKGNNPSPEDEVIEHKLAYAVVARAVRFYPEEFLISGCLRIELYGYYMSDSMCPYLNTKVRKEECIGDGNCGSINAKCKLNEATNTSECTCVDNYHGKDCQLSGCKHNPCGNHGQCIGDENTTFKCMCEPGYKGRYCELPCPTGTYGVGCKNQCDCPDKEYCNPTTGACSCLPGFYGVNCDEPCQNKTYGQDCKNMCSCDQYRECDHRTGFCQCPAGRYGETCQLQCENGKYGKDCKESCLCINGGVCNTTTGQCDCPAGWIGSICDVPCPSNRYGKHCSHLCQNMVNARCDPVTGHPICKPGFTGQHCQEECVDNKYGENCQYSCQCDKVNTIKCDTKNGSCSCRAGYTGKNCESECKDSWGLNCQHECLCKNGGTCDVVTGACFCPAGLIGTKCEKSCPQGRYGNNCSNVCVCVLKYTDECQTRDGRCRCMPGYQGIRCNEKCKKNYWGRNCAESCKCLNNGVCDHRDGFCYCPDGYQGQFCENLCDEGKYGKNCNDVCLCRNGGECDSIDGHCECNPGFSGTYCEHQCPRGTYGLHCREKCDCILDNTEQCNPVNGSCACKAGYQGIQCEKSCDDGFFGPHCTSQCECYHSIRHCLKTNGTCSCNRGFMGTKCHQDCDWNHFGHQCSQSCQCLEQELCSNINGECYTKNRYLFTVNLLIDTKTFLETDYKHLFVRKFQHIASQCFDPFYKDFLKTNTSKSGVCNLQRERRFAATPADPDRYFVRVFDATTKYTMDRRALSSISLLFMYLQKPVNASVMESFLQYVGKENFDAEVSPEYYIGEVMNSLPTKAWYEGYLKYVAISGGLVLLILVILLILCTRKVKNPPPFKKIKNHQYSSSAKKEIELQMPMLAASGLNHDRHLLAFENPYYDVIAAMGLDNDDIEEDYYNPLYDLNFIQQTDSEDSESDDLYFYQRYQQRQRLRQQQIAAGRENDDDDDEEDADDGVGVGVNYFQNYPLNDKDSGFSSGNLM